MLQRRKAVGVQHTSDLAEELKASMDVEVAIGAASSLGRLDSFGQRTASIAASVEIVEASRDPQLAPASEDTVVPNTNDPVLETGPDQIKNRRLAIAPTRNNTVELAKTLLTSNSLAAARSRHIQFLTEKAEREAAEALLAAEANATQGTPSTAKSQSTSRGAGRGRPRPESVVSRQNNFDAATMEAAPAAKLKRGLSSGQPNRVDSPAPTRIDSPKPTVFNASICGGAEAEPEVQLISEGSYTEVNELYGLTGERVMRYELVGVGRDKVAQLRSLFISLDEGGDGELGPLELYSALVKFGQNVTDKEVRAMMEEVDKDNSGSIGFEEFLLLAVPGASSEGTKVKRDFVIPPYDPASFQDTVIYGSAVTQDGVQDHEKPNRNGANKSFHDDLALTIPMQCFSFYNPDEEFVPVKQNAQAKDVAEGILPAREEPEVSRQEKKSESLGLEMRLRFKMTPNLRVTDAAAKGNIETKIKVVKCWTPRRYLFGKKELAPRDGKGAGIVFTVPPSDSDCDHFPGPPKNKYLCVQFPGKKKEVTLYDGCPTIYGFPILQITKKTMRINFEVPHGESFMSMSHLATFPPPIENVTILSCGAGALLSDLRKIVASESFLPIWYPFSFSTLCLNEEGKPRRIDIKEDLGELENLPNGNVCLDVYLTAGEMVKSLINFASAQYSWVADMECIDFKTSTNVMIEITFRGGSVNLVNLAQDLRIGVRMTEQIEQKSWRDNRGWISCPPHPHVLPLLLSATANIFLSPYTEGVSGDMIADILNASLLKERQVRIIHIRIGLQMALAIEHMHSHDIWHLDLKPSNLLITLDDTDPDKPRFWQQIHVRVCDYSRCSAHTCANMSRRGTVGYWSPEQVHNRVDPSIEPTADLYWGRKKSKDPPPKSLADMSERSDSWGWATTMLGLMGRLDEMRKQGYQTFLQELLSKGFQVDLSAIFLYEQQAFIDILQSELDGVHKIYAKIKKAWTKLSEDVERQRMDLDPVWQTAVQALQNLNLKDYKQLVGYKRAPSLLKLLNEAIGAIFEFEKKATADWNNFKGVVYHFEFVSTLLNFNKDKGLSIQSVKDLTRVFKNPEFQIEAFVESNIPPSDPASPGSAIDVATAYFHWVVAINKFNVLRKELIPIQMEMKRKEDEMTKLDPKVAALEQKIDQQNSDLNILKNRLNANNRTVLELVRGTDKDRALPEIARILQMGSALLTNQQFKQLQHDCLLSTGDHSQVFRVLAWMNKLPLDSTVRLGITPANTRRVFAKKPTVAPSVRTIMDDLYDKYACLRATRPKDQDGIGGQKDDFSRANSTFSAAPSTFSKANSTFSGIEEEDDDELTWDHFPSAGDGVYYIFNTAGDSLATQHKRHDVLGFHSKGDGVGDALSLVLAWCLQHQPIDRVPISGVAAVLMQLSPGQEWQHKGTVPGKAGIPKPGLDTSAFARAYTMLAPKLAAAMIGDRNDASTELSLLERKAIWAFEARDLIKASHFYMDVLKKIEMLNEIDTYWMQLAKTQIAMSRTRLLLGSISEADEWQKEALKLVQAHQQEDPSDASGCTPVCLCYHQSQANDKRKRGTTLANLSVTERQVLIQHRILWADVKMQEAAVMVAKVTENGVNLYFKALEIMLRAATVLQEVLGSESKKVAAALRAIGEVQVLRGRYRDALDIYKRALRIQTRVTGYDGYAAHPCIASMLHSMAEINIVLGKHSVAIGLLERAIHIYVAVDSRGHDYPMISAVKESLGRAYQGCLRYGDASRSFQDAFDTSTRRILLNERQDIALLTRCEEIRQRGAVAIILAKYSVAYADYMQAASLYSSALKGMNWFGDKLEDNSELAVADCLLGAGTSQFCMGDHWKALELYQQAYQQILHRTTDEHNLKLADVCERMASCYLSMNKKGIALEWLDRAVSIRETCQGMAHVDLAHTLTRISALLRSAGQYSLSQDFTIRSMHIYVAVFERNHICVAEAIENLAAALFPNNAQKYNIGLRKLEALALQVDSKVARVKRCEVRAEVARESLVKLKKTPGIKKLALKSTEDKLEKARQDVKEALEDEKLFQERLRLRKEKSKIARASCEECLAIVEEAVAIVKEILPDPCQKLTNLENGSKKMRELLHSLVAWANVYASNAHTEADSPPDSPGGPFSRVPSFGRTKTSVTVMDAISEGQVLGEELTAAQTNVGLGTNPVIESSTPRSSQLPLQRMLFP